MTDNPSLQQKLEQYSTTIKGQTTTGHSAAEIAGYAAAAGAALAMAGTADATIVYSGVRDISVEIKRPTVTNNSFSTYAFKEVDIDSDGKPDILLNVEFKAFKTSSGYSGTYSGFGGIRGIGGAKLLVTGNTTFIAGSNLTGSNTIDSRGNFGERWAGISQTSGGKFYGNFAMSVAGFAGIQLNSGNYGWIRLHIADLGLNQPFSGLINNGKDFPDKVTVIDWAYEDSGASIHVPVPEPSSLALLAAGAAGLSAFRRRKAEQRV